MKYSSHPLIGVENLGIYSTLQESVALLMESRDREDEHTSNGSNNPERFCYKIYGGLKDTLTVVSCL